MNIIATVATGLDLPDWTDRDNPAADPCDQAITLDSGIKLACSRDQSHTGNHAAGDSDCILVIWTEE